MKKREFFIRVRGREGIKLQAVTGYEYGAYFIHKCLIGKQWTISYRALGMNIGRSYNTLREACVTLETDKELSTRVHEIADRTLELHPDWFIINNISASEYINIRNSMC